MRQKVKQVFWIFLVDTYILIISFALLKVVELMLKSFWANEVRLLKLMDLAFTLPILLVYVFLLSFDLCELFQSGKQEVN